MLRLLIPFVWVVVFFLPSNSSGFFFTMFCFYLSFSCCAQFWRIFHSVRFCLVTLNAFCSVVPLLNRFRVSISDKFANRFDTNASVRSGRSLSKNFFRSSLHPACVAIILMSKIKLSYYLNHFHANHSVIRFIAMHYLMGFFCVTNEVLILIFYLEGKCVRACVCGGLEMSCGLRAEQARLMCRRFALVSKPKTYTPCVDDVIFAKYWLLFIPALSSPLRFKYNRTMRNVVLIR